MKAYESLESYKQFVSRWVKEVKIKLLLNYLLKLPWLLDGSARNVFPSSFYCSILIRCIIFIASATISGAKEDHLAIQLLWAIARLLITSVSTIYQVDEFLFFFLLFLPLRPTQQRAGWRNLVYLECL